MLTPCHIEVAGQRSGHTHLCSHPHAYLPPQKISIQAASQPPRTAVSKLSPWWLAELPQNPWAASAPCRHQTMVEAGVVGKVQRWLLWSVPNGVSTGLCRGDTEKVNCSVLNNKGRGSCFLKNGYFHRSSSSALCSFLPGACRVPNCKAIPHGSFHVACNVVISQESKKKMFKFSSGSTPEQQVWFRWLKSTFSSTSPQLPWDSAMQI